MYIKEITEFWGKTDVEGTKNYLRSLETAGEITTFVMKYPGEHIDCLEYPGESFIACFAFKEQLEWINKFSIKNIAADTTYNTNMYNSYLVLFLV